MTKANHMIAVPIELQCRGRIPPWSRPDLSNSTASSGGHCSRSGGDTLPTYHPWNQNSWSSGRFPKMEKDMAKADEKKWGPMSRRHFLGAVSAG